MSAKKKNLSAATLMQPTAFCSDLLLTEMASVLLSKK